MLTNRQTDKKHTNRHCCKQYHPSRVGGKHTESVIKPIQSDTDSESLASGYYVCTLYRHSRQRTWQ